MRQGRRIATLLFFPALLRSGRVAQRYRRARRLYRLLRAGFDVPGLHGHADMFLFEALDAGQRELPFEPWAAALRRDCAQHTRRRFAATHVKHSANVGAGHG